jgi:hypothetical protein
LHRQVYLAGLGSGLGGEQRLPPYYPAPVYQQLAAAHRLANIHRSLLSGARAEAQGPDTQPSAASEVRKRPAAQFSIDELLRHDDKRGKPEPGDSKATPFDEVEPAAVQAAEGGLAAEGGSVKAEPRAGSPAPSCLALALAGAGPGLTHSLRTSPPRCNTICKRRQPPLTRWPRVEMQFRGGFHLF